MTSGTPCYCINPHCSSRQNQFNFQQKNCQACGTPLVVQPHNVLLREPLYGFAEEGTNSEIFVVESLGLARSDYPQLLKILQPNMGAIAERLFQQEGELLQQLRGYAVPRVGSQPYFQVSVSETKGNRRNHDLHCLVMEHIEGQSLDQVLQEGIISTVQAIDWLRQLAQLLLTIHRQNIIHRDIKPANLIVREKAGFPYGELVLIDFGTARRSTPTYVEKVAGDRPMTRIVSAGYAAPEQFAGKYTFKSDLFAAGRTIMHLMTGIHPAAQDYETLDWRELIPQRALRKLLLKLTQLKPKQRPKSAAALCNEISRLLKVVDAHPLQAWFSLYKPRLIKGAALASALGIFLPIGLRAGAVLLPAEQLNEVAFSTYQSENYSRSLWLYTALKNKRSGTLKPFGAYGMARSSEELQNYDLAIQHYQEAIALDNNQSEVSCRAAADLGHLFLIRDDFTNAIKYLQQALECTEEEKTQAAVQRHLAASFFDRGEFQKATSYLSEALLFDDQHPVGLCLQEAFVISKQSAANGNISAVDCLF